MSLLLIINIMSNTETPKNIHESIEESQNALNDLNENLKKELFERLKEDKKIPRAKIIKELKEHGIVSYLYKEYPTDIDLA